MDWKVLAWNIASTVFNGTYKTVMDRVVDSITSEKYQQLEFLEEQEKIEPALAMIELIPATALKEYDGKLVEIGLTSCPFCQALHEKLKPRILKGKADVLWVDRDPLGFYVFRELELDSVPSLFKVKAEGDKVILVNTKTGDTHVFKDKIVLGTEENTHTKEKKHEKRKKIKAKKA